MTLIGSKNIKLEPEEKEKFMVLKSDDPKAQILYQELEFGNYMLYIETNDDEGRVGVVKPKNSTRDQGP